MTSETTLFFSLEKTSGNEWQLDNKKHKRKTRCLVPNRSEGFLTQTQGKLKEMLLEDLDPLNISETSVEMVARLRDKKCKIPTIEFIDCSDSNSSFAGSNSSDFIKICKGIPAEMIVSTIAHELIHSWDLCKLASSSTPSTIEGPTSNTSATINSSPFNSFSTIENLSCLQIACTELRAAKYSGDCSKIQEFYRLNLFSLFPMGLERCARRRAKISLLLHERCKGVDGDTVIEQVWDCFKSSL